MKKTLILITLFSILFEYSLSQKVEILGNSKQGYQLLKNGEPYYINGAGGTVELDKLLDFGGNSIRTWGISDETDKILEIALEKNISVTFGIWMGQERQGFDYSNKDAVKAQLEEFRRIVRKYKNHPAILFWGVGNEMDLDYTNFDVWKHLEEIIKMIHKEDPNHPTMAVTAGIDPAEIKLINKYTPSLDVLGVNTYGDISYLPEAIQAYGWKKPYIVAEWGPIGWWESKTTSWGASIEQTSTEKAKTYEKSINAIFSDKKNCLGSYVFLWGHKQEHTSTWFGLFTEKGHETEVTDVLIKNWTDKEPQNYSPTLTSFLLNNQTPEDNITVQPSSDLFAKAKTSDIDSDPLIYEWQIVPESTDKKTGGDAEKAPKPIRGIIPRNSHKQKSINFQAPNKAGEYRLFLFVYDNHNNVATGNIPFKVEK